MARTTRNPIAAPLPVRRSTSSFLPLRCAAGPLPPSLSAALPALSLASARARCGSSPSLHLPRPISCTAVPLPRSTSCAAGPLPRSISCAAGCCLSCAAGVSDVQKSRPPFGLA
ncbi:hypothetical protein VPH35_035500 [Triticum aestivum]